MAKKTNDCQGSPCKDIIFQDKPYQNPADLKCVTHVNTVNGSVTGNGITFIMFFLNDVCVYYSTISL